MSRAADRLLEVLGIQRVAVSHAERLISGLGGFLGIFFVFLITRHFTGGQSAAVIVASMGATAVLLYAVPHSPLAQPWAVLGGHGLSAVTGVTVAQLLPGEWLAAPIAVGLAIVIMHYTRCIHPPGGASALAATVGGPEVVALGYQYVLTPVLINAVIIVTVSVLFNAFFAWRRYPAGLMRRQREATPEHPYPGISHEDFVYALSTLDSFIDVSENDLARIYELARHKHDTPALHPADIRPGACYSNGLFGSEWAVRQIIDEQDSGDPERGLIIYRTVAGAGRRSTGTMTRAEFARWARHEVYRDDENWRRVGGHPSHD